MPNTLVNDATCIPWIRLSPFPCLALHPARSAQYKMLVGLCPPALSSLWVLCSAQESTRTDSPYGLKSDCHLPIDISPCMIYSALDTDRQIRMDTAITMRTWTPGRHTPTILSLT